MSNLLIRYCILTDRNGKRVVIRRPLLGRMTYTSDAGRPTIVRTTFWGVHRLVVPGIEDRIEIDY